MKIFLAGNTIFPKYIAPTLNGGGFSDVNENLSCGRDTVQREEKYSGGFDRAILEHRPYILESFYYADEDTERLLPLFGDFMLDSITYILSDVFSEVYGYKWSRITATWAFIGTLLCSLFFALTIALPGNAAWDKQDQLVNILGSSPQIASASIIAFWCGDFVNDKVFQFMKKHSKNQKGFALRAILSSLAGKYVDGAIFTFFGLSFLPLQTKAIMVAECPFVQICIEILVLPVTFLVVRLVQKAEKKV